MKYIIFEMKNVKENFVIDFPRLFASVCCNESRKLRKCCEKIRWWDFPIMWRAQRATLNGKFIVLSNWTIYNINELIITFIFCWTQTLKSSVLFYVWYKKNNNNNTIISREEETFDWSFRVRPRFASHITENLQSRAGDR